MVKYSIEFKKIALKDLEKINKKDAIRILSKIKELEEDLKGDVKRLTNYTPEYRLRFGNFRILFEISGKAIIIYKIKHRKDSYH
jgi:mRNA interferase RelE/StbE